MELFTITAIAAFAFGFAALSFILANFFEKTDRKRMEEIIRQERFREAQRRARQAEIERLLKDAMNQYLKKKTIPWHEYLGVPPNATEGQINRAYREKAKKFHPDAGGSAAKMASLNRAREIGLRICKGT